MRSRYFTITRRDVTMDQVTGHMTVPFPLEYINSQSQVKHIEIMRFLYFNTHGEPEVGTSCHASFNTVDIINDQMICYSNFGSSVTKVYDVMNRLRVMEFWFRNYRGEMLFPEGVDDEYFLLELNLIF